MSIFFLGNYCKCQVTSVDGVWVGLTHCTDCLALKHLLKTMQTDEFLWTPAEHTVLAGVLTNGACQGSLRFWPQCSNSHTSSQLPF